MAETPQCNKSRRQTSRELTPTALKPNLKRAKTETAPEEPPESSAKIVPAEHVESSAETDESLTRTAQAEPAESSACHTMSSTLVVEVDTASSSTVTVAKAPVLNHNSEYMRKVEAEIGTVLRKVPELAKASQPLTTEQGSDMSPFSFAEFEKLMKERKSYRCAGNISWVATTTPTPEQRLSEKKKNDLQDIMSKRPDLLTIKVHVDKDWSEKDLMSQINNAGLQMMVAVEPLHAWWGAFAVFVKDDNEEKIKEWTSLGLSIPIHMAHLDSVDDCSSESMNFRELLQEMGDILRVTPLMRILHWSAWKTGYLKKQKKKIGVQVLLDEYKTKNSAVATKSEKLTSGWADMANTIDTRMLGITEVKETLLEAEDFPTGTNPIEGMSMLQIIIFC